MNRYYQLRLQPRDLLFCRDGKPMTGSWTGYGGRWPLGGTFHGAVLAALQQHCQMGPRSGVFSSLRTIGPFPEVIAEGKSELFFPTPLDILPDGSLLQPEDVCGECNLPKPLSKVLMSHGKPSKKTVPQWISAKDLLSYLYGSANNSWVWQALRDDSARPPVLYDCETRPGIAIDSVSRCVNREEQKFYMAEYLRLRPDVALAGFIRLDESNNQLYKMSMTDEEKLKKSFFDGTIFQLGGQQCVVRASLLERTPVPDSNPLFLASRQISGTRLKWVLLTPACWNNGWLPGFIDPDNGNVMLKSGNEERLPGETRDAWRARKTSLPGIKAKLVAARIGNAVPVSGIKMKQNGTFQQRPTAMFVPAGSVFYFETESPEESQKLAHALSGRNLTHIGGEYGYGLGVCAAF